MIPTSKSRKWIIIFIIYTIIIFAALLSTRILLDTELLNRSLLNIFLLSLCSASLPCAGGYYGKRIFFFLDSVSIIIGIAYALSVAAGDIAPGWGELVSMIGFLFIIFVGFIVAFNGELIGYFIRKYRR